MNSIIDSYKCVIEIINNGDYDANKIAILLAKENPDLFVKLHNYEVETILPEKKMYQFALKNYLANGKQPIQTIKDLRFEFNIGLKEAKDIIDKVRDDLERF